MMEQGAGDIADGIRELFGSFSGSPVERVEKLPRSGSDRSYFRVYTPGATFIATHNLNTRETDTFVYFSRHFRSLGLPVPEILAVDSASTLYIQEDLGHASLLDELERNGRTEEVKDLFKQSLSQLARLQILGHEGLDYARCLTAREFGSQAILNDLLYFKYYFLDTLKLPYDKQAMLNDFQALASYLTHTRYKFFLFRDFQSRNILVKDGKVWFIDYQGGMQGALQYDVASLLWQARAELSDEWKKELLEYYMDQAGALLGETLDRASFTGQYHGYILIRLLQVMGAYGFRGLFERKAQFLSSIPQALRNLKWFVDRQRIGISLPEFDRILRIIVQDDMIARFEPIRATDATPLVVHIRSFSYRNGYPPDASGTGGGFVFDCRGILNPGRYDEFKKLCGQDKEVQDFLEQRTRMSEFLNSVFDIVDISVEDYLRRGFASLSVSFGCTGGQHRSVYAAEQLRRHLRNKFRVKVELEHSNCANWVR